MKHPFQIVVSDRAGAHIFASVKNQLTVFSADNGKVLGNWVDDVDVSAKLKKAQADETSQENAAKKAKTNKKTPKIPVPGPGAPPIYNYIRTLSLSQDEKYLVGTTDSDKAAIVFKINYNNANCLELVKRQVFPKRPCAVSTTPDSKTVIVADKFGDVYSMDIEGDTVGEKSLVPILGHVSMLSDVLVAEKDGRQFVITGDRDEHIRITNYPKSYVVKNWLFGHHEFVSHLHVPAFDLSVLISAGGDDYVAFWNWYDGVLLSKVHLGEILQPYLTDAHLPPARFLTEDSPRELSVVKVVTLGDKKRQMVVLCENTKCLVVFDINEDFSATHKQTFETDHSIVDIALVKDSIVAAVDVDNDQLVEVYGFKDGVLEKENAEDLVKSISSANTCEVESRKDFYPLYYINSLRKRSEH